MISVTKHRRTRCTYVAVVVSFACAFYISSGRTESAPQIKSPESGSLWARDRLVPWVVGVYDEQALAPEERAGLLERLGFKRFAYFWEPDERDIRAIDAELEALQTHGIDPVAWWFSYSATDPFAKALLEAFKRHHVHPQLWVSPTYRDAVATYEQYHPKGIVKPRTQSDLDRLSPQDHAAVIAAFEKQTEVAYKDTYAATPQDQERHIQQEADRIEAIERLATPYGNRVALYNHGGWSGIMDNQIAIIERLKVRGVPNVGIVYAFNHVRDAQHDDTVNFPVLWKKIKPYVVAVTLTGICTDDGTTAYPSQGDRELEMMRTIQETGWHGVVGVFAGDWNNRDAKAATTLQNILLGVDWLAAELKQPGSAGPRPFPNIPLAK